MVNGVETDITIPDQTGLGNGVPEVLATVQLGQVHHLAATTQRTPIGELQCAAESCLVYHWSTGRLPSPLTPLPAPRLSPRRDRTSSGRTRQAAQPPDAGMQQWIPHNRSVAHDPLPRARTQLPKWHQAPTGPLDRSLVDRKCEQLASEAGATSGPDTMPQTDPCTSCHGDAP